MDVQVYNKIISTIRNFDGLTMNCLQLLKENFKGIDEDALYSILSLEYQKQMKHNHSKAQSTRNKYLEQYRQSLQNRDPPGIIVRIAIQHKIAPCLIAKIILQKYIDDRQTNEKELVAVNTYMRDTSLIPDLDLSYEVFLCTLYDNLYSPISESVKHSIGQQYEIKLHKEIVELGLAFRDEEYLRKFGYDKTPDVKLDVPIAIDGMIINWIESKALFGNEDAHKDYMINQYLSYWNRFGSGLIIYWFGYLETIVESNDKRFLIRDHLPKNIIKMPVVNFVDS